MIIRHCLKWHWELKGNEQSGIWLRHWFVNNWIAEGFLLRIAEFFGCCLFQLVIDIGWSLVKVERAESVATQSLTHCCFPLLPEMAPHPISHHNIPRFFNT